MRTKECQDHRHEECKEHIAKIKRYSGGLVEMIAKKTTGKPYLDGLYYIPCGCFCHKADKYRIARDIAILNGGD